MNELLTDAEHEIIDMIAGVSLRLRSIIGDGITRKNDTREILDHIHALQNMVMAQAAARAYPEKYRLMGSVVQKKYVHVCGHPCINLPDHQDYGDPCTHREAYENVKTHTRVHSMDGCPDVCSECSESLGEWIEWPCPRERKSDLPLLTHIPEIDHNHSANESCSRNCPGNKENGKTPAIHHYSDTDAVKGLGRK